MRQTKNILATLVMLIAFWACNQDNDLVEPVSFSDVAWSVAGQFPGQPINVNEGDQVSFRDVSVGVSSRKWIIAEGNRFLNPNFTKADTSFERFINPNLDTVSNSGLVSVLFMNGGLNTVKLRNVFRDSVSYNASTDTIKSIKTDEGWVFENTFEVDVYAKIRPAFKVYYDGEEVLNVTETDTISIADLASWKTINVEAGGTVSFVDKTTIGRPESRTWRPVGGRVVNTNSADSANFKFNSLGFYTGHKLTSQRGSNQSPIPVFRTEKLIPLKINVIQSSQPFVIDSEKIIEKEDETLVFAVSGEVPSAVGTAEDFTVHVTNSNGFDDNISVTSVLVNDADKTQLELKLSQPIYNSDVITVSYSGGSIKSVDERELSAFDEIPVEMFRGESQADRDIWSFEVTDTESRTGLADFDLPANVRDPAIFFGVSDIPAAHGTMQLRYQIDDFAAGVGKQEVWESAAAIAPLTEPGDYLLSMKIYRPAGNAVKTLRVVTTPPFKVHFIKFEDIEDDTWTEYTSQMKLDEQMSGDFSIQLRPSDNGGVTGAQTFYIDDIQFTKLELRPTL